MQKTWTSRLLSIAGALWLLVFVAAGCGKGTQAGGTGPSGQGHFHPVAWLAQHPAQAVTSLGSCVQCHEMTALRVGSAIPSCMTADCHHRPVPGWSSAGSHGAKAKAAPGPTGGGFASCQLCHGQDFKGGASGSACASCHGVQAPHPAKPWRGSSASTHGTVDPANAGVCAQCHFAGAPANPPNHPGSPAPSGTIPGCFNNTLCHGSAVAPHAVGALWLNPTSTAFHGFDAKKDLLYCQVCHGTPGTAKFDGGVAPTACSSCHNAAGAHSKPWHPAPVATFPGYVPSHRNALKLDTACAVCHDVVKGRPAPVPASPSCYASSEGAVGCHAGGPGKANHPIPFLDTTHTSATQGAFDTNCGNCHGVSGSSPLAAAPLCAACHQAGTPLTLPNCTSCHARPPAGGAFPNIAGSHAKHEALESVTGRCGVCHQGSESGTQLHYDHANGRPGSDGLRTAPGETGFQATFQAKSGTAAFNPANLTCSSISCHGGQTTPNFQSGRIDANGESGCAACHVVGTAQGTPENNSAFSGLHALHMSPQAGAQCVDCHAMANGTAGAQNHFRFLNTSQMEGPASTTVAPMGNPAYYAAANQSCGTFTCHEKPHGNLSWIGGANHPVPFLDTAHLTARQTGFDANCKGCHGDSGSSPVPAAPTCATCHQAGSVLAAAACVSCHGRPPAGAAFPDDAGRHAKHEALPGVGGLCSSCHANADTLTLVHYDHANARPGKDALRKPPAPTSFLSIFNAKAGSPAFNPAALTCGSISCHGGVTTPSWKTGSLDANSEAGCRSCHTLGTALGLPENNSPFSGLHAVHLAAPASAQCVECHVMSGTGAGAQNHFKFLSTPQMEGPASSTIAPQGVPAYYTPATQSCGSFSCHGTQHDGYLWTGGPNHAVPFTGAVHLSSTSASFNADCKNCHAVSGASPLPSAPNCAVCHQAGSPLAIPNCASCHGRPPAGTAFPDIAGSHAKHETLQGVTGVCNACHDAAGTGTSTHYSHANGRPGQDALRTPPGEVKALSAYNARTGTAGFNTSSLTCSNVSCHGGQTTPNWRTGTLNSTVEAGCRACHAIGTGSGSPQYNSAWSGSHPKHDGGEVRALCTECHAMTNGTTGAQNHFRFLGTSVMEGPAGQTVAPLGNAASYNQATRTCTLTCHGQEHQNQAWVGGN